MDVTFAAAGDVDSICGSWGVPSDDYGRPISPTARFLGCSSVAEDRVRVVVPWRGSVMLHEFQHVGDVRCRGAVIE